MPKGSYKYRKSFSFNGKRYEVYARTEKELYEKMFLKKRELEKGRQLVNSNTLFRDWAEEWLITYKEPTVKEITFRTIRGVVYGDLLPELGNMPIRTIKAVHCQKLLNGKPGRSAYHYKRVKQILSDILEKAVENNMIETNPAKKLVLPKAEAGTHRAITKQEREVVLKVAEYDKAGLWVLTMLYCGLRPHELELLQGRHIDFNKQVIHVPGTKTSNAERDVPIPLQFLPKIPHKGAFEYIFLSEQGHPLNPSISARWWRSFKNNMNIEMGCRVYRNKVMPPYAVAPDLTPYCFRHTFCTDLQAAGVPINVAKELMGHSDISLTARIYTHHSEEAFQNAANLINKFHAAK